MKAISEMSLTELQDFAQERVDEIAALRDEIAQKDAKQTELSELNLDLQKRNNALFRKVSQGYESPDSEDSDEGSEEIKTCEEFAAENFRRFI